MTSPKNVSELKRCLTLGAKIECTLFDGQIPSGRMRGVGVVDKVQTNGVYIKRSLSDIHSFFNFPKAKEYRPLGLGYFSVSDVVTRQYRLCEN